MRSRGPGGSFRSAVDASREYERITSVSGMSSVLPVSGGAQKRTIRLQSQSVCGQSVRASKQFMGVAPSGTAPCEGDCRLPETDLRFSATQIERAEHLIAEDIRDAAPETLADDELGDSVVLEAYADADAERLLQWLLCAVATEDSRFRCKFLVCLGRRARCAEYMIRLDALSSPALYDVDDPPACVIEEGGAGETLPQGYARVRLRSVAAAEDWAEFLCPAGCLRRDKVQERFVELLAAAVANVTALTATKGDDVDESRMCGVAGKVIDADILPELLSTQADTQLFVGSSSTTPLRQESIAIVEGCPWIRLHVGGVQLKLALAVTTERWPRSSALPSRVSLTHPDCLLIQHACASGCAAVATGPPPSSTSAPGSRSTSWQIWMPATAAIFKHHYSPRAAPRRVERALVAVRAITRLRTVSRHALRVLLWWKLEETPTADWAPRAAVRHTLALLDSLVGALRQRRLKCYFFNGVNVLTASPRGTWRPAEQLDDADYAWDADAVDGYLRRLLHASSSVVCLEPLLSWPGEEPATSWQLVEEALAPKWGTAVRAVTHGAPTRSRRLAIRAVRRHRIASGTLTESQSGSEAFLSPQQLDYVIAVMRGLLRTRSLLLEGPPTKPWYPGGPGDSSDMSEVDDDVFIPPTASPSGDVACVVAAALQQARAQALQEMSPGSRTTLSTIKHRRSSAGGRALKQFDQAARQLMAAVRRDLSSHVVTDDRSLVRGALRWLQCAQDRAPRVLAAPLRHWLRGLSSTTSSASWMLPQWTSARRRNRDEVAALGATLGVITAGRATPAAAIADAERKGWRWAAQLAAMPPGTLAVAAPSPGKVVRFPVGAPLLTATTDRRVRRKTFATSGSATMPASVAREFSALLNNTFHQEIDPVGDVRPVHCRLREDSPSTALFAARRRYGLLRGIGDTMPALLRMQKFGLVHEAVSSGRLSEEQRSEILAALQTATRESRRQAAVARRRSKERTLPLEVYRPKSALIIEAPIAKVSLRPPPIPDADARLEAEMRRLSIADSLMSAVRAWRSSALLVDPCGPQSTLYSLTAANDEDDLGEESPLPKTDLSFLELTDDKTLRLGKVREGITKL